MGIDTEKYIRKPLYVDAVRITEENFDEMAAWCQGEVKTDQDVGDRSYIRVRVHNPKNARQTKAFVGDWLLYTERGYKIYTNKAFHASFDPVPGEQAVAEAQSVTEPPTEEAATTHEYGAGESKRVLSRREQVEMPQDEIQALLRSGEVVLEQDLAA